MLESTDDPGGGMKARRAKQRRISRSTETALLRRLRSELGGARDQVKEAHAEQTATSEILRVIASSPADIGPVFATILDNAVRLCDRPPMAAMFRFDGMLLHLLAARNISPKALAAMRRTWPAAPDPRLVSGRAILRRQIIRLEDNRADPDYDSFLSTIGGWRRMLAVPMLRKGIPLGVFVVSWPTPGPIPDRQVELLKTFADQAVIAIENARLFNETNEALEQQTATAQVLQVMSKSQTDMQPVFDAIVKNAVRLCEGVHGSLFRFDDALQHFVAHYGVDSETIERLQRRYPRPPSPGTVTGRALLERSIMHVTDLQADPRFPDSNMSFKQAGYRSVLAVPMLKESQPIGVILVVRREARPYSDKQITLLRTFADQAVIAIENVRLFNETKAALERQTATSEILRVISSSPTDIQPVLDAVVESAARLCEAQNANLFRVEGDLMRKVSQHGSLQTSLAVGQARPITRGSVSGRAIGERRTVHVKDSLTVVDAEYPDVRETVHREGIRTVVAVPLLREGTPIGAITVYRTEGRWKEPVPRPFSDEQIALLQTFADQAVIAIENVRLFNETKEALDQQKASAEILRVISSSVADAQPVFDKILESCERLFGGRNAGITLIGDDGRIHLRAYHGPQVAELERHFPLPLTRESGSGTAILERRVVHYPDHEAPGVPEYARQGAKIAGNKSSIFAPMMWEGEAIGTIFVARHFTGAFSEKEAGLLKTFADQAVIAIQNARLFREIQEKGQQLEIASRHKSEFLANMSHELRTPLNAIIGFARIVMRRSKESLEPKQYENLEKILASGEHLLALINAILDLSKVEAGRVEVHPAEVPLGPVLEHCVRTVEPLLKSPVSLLKEFDGELPQAYVDEEKLRQIVINLLSNAVKFTEHGTVRVRAKCNGDRFAVAVADTGVGIPADKLEHVFEEFTQADASSTRVYGGTGLGLTIARRLARLMGGDIAVHSVQGQGSTFTLDLPLRYHA